ncbi:hypothetical protein HYW53_02280 [Candidatus Giovannonibacteria bacterium]|nr:hypothetical protein [Candidatus Giovannonibacteria bacterium]
MINRGKKSDNGFAALITVIVLSAILLTVALTLNQSGFFARSAILDSEYKERSSTLAEACVDQALVKLVADPAYGGNETISFGADACSVRPILFDSPASGKTTIETKANFNEAITNLRIVVNSSDHALDSWVEIPSF